MSEQALSPLEREIERLPPGWDLVRLKHAAAVSLQNGVGESAQDFNPDWPRYLRITDIDGPRSLSDHSLRSLPPEIAADAKVERGDLLLAAVGATYGKSYLHLDDTLPACYAGYLVRYRPDKSVLPEWASYWTESTHYWSQVRANVVQSTIQNFSAGKYKELEIPRPPATEQRRRVAYLNRKTVDTDTLIRKKQAIIDLLREHRTALIYRAVTKGLDPSVPMKDSGVEWLGDVPQHWTVPQLKYMTAFVNGAAFKPDEWGSEGTPIIRISNLNGDPQFNCSKREVPHKYHVQFGDLLFSWSGNIGTSFGPFRWHREGLHYLNQHIFRLDDYKYQKEYFYWMLKAATTHIEQQAHGIIGMVHITKPDLGAVRVPDLPKAEQSTISNYLDEQTYKIDSIIDREYRQIDLLSSLRSSLISGVVTGKIDVRDANAVEAAT